MKRRKYFIPPLLEIQFKLPGGYPELLNTYRYNSKPNKTGPKSLNF